MVFSTRFLLTTSRENVNFKRQLRILTSNKPQEQLLILFCFSCLYDCWLFVCVVLRGEWGLAVSIQFSDSDTPQSTIENLEPYSLQYDILFNI
jgi:hypothetical protein